MTTSPQNSVPEFFIGNSLIHLQKCLNLLQDTNSWPKGRFPIITISSTEKILGIRHVLIQTEKFVHNST